MGKPRPPANEPESQAARSPGWPPWARRAVTVALLLHMTAVVAGALSMPPSSPLEQRFASLFAHYYELTDQGQAYRYYAPEPPPTPVVTAHLQFADGRPEQQVRLPERGVRPRLRYQRQLALANHLYNDVQSARQLAGDEQASRWAASYARHLCKTRGCSRVTLFVQMHLIPDPAQASAQSGIEIDSEEFYTAPERIGEFSCDAF